MAVEHREKLREKTRSTVVNHESDESAPSCWRVFRVETDVSAPNAAQPIMIIKRDHRDTLKYIVLPYTSPTIDRVPARPRAVGQLTLMI